MTAPCNRGTSPVVGGMSGLAGVDVHAGDGSATTTPPVLTPSSVMSAPCSFRSVREVTWMISTVEVPLTCHGFRRSCHGFSSSPVWNRAGQGNSRGGGGDYPRLWGSWCATAPDVGNRDGKWSPTSGGGVDSGAMEMLSGEVFIAPGGFPPEDPQAGWGSVSEATVAPFHVGQGM